MQIDSVKNFVKVLVSTGYDAAATSVVLSSGQGAKLPAAPFSMTWWNNTDYADPSDDPNVEIVRVTAVSTDTITIMRAQEGTSASTKNTGGKTYRMLAGLTALSFQTTQFGANTVTYVVDAGGDGHFTTLEAALAALATGPGIVHVKAGVYIVPIGGYGIYSKQIIRGEGEDNTYFDAQNLTSGSVFFNAVAPTDISYAQFENFTVQRTGGISTGLYGFDMTNFNDSELRQINIRNMDRALYNNGGGYYNDYFSLRAISNNYMMYFANKSNEQHFFGGNFLDSNTQMIHIDNCDQIVFFASAFEGDNQDVQLTNTSSNISFFGCRFEMTNTGGTSTFTIDSGVGNIQLFGGFMSGMTFTDNGANNMYFISSSITTNVFNIPVKFRLNYYNALGSVSSGPVNLSLTTRVLKCTSGTFQVNLLTAVGNSGAIFTIKNSGSGTITVAPQAGQTIDGNATVTLTQNQVVNVVSDGANYLVI